MKDYVLILEVSDQEFEQLAKEYKFAVIGTQFGWEDIVGFSNVKDPKDLTELFDAVRFAPFAEVKEMANKRYTDLWVLGDYEKIKPKYKYTLMGRFSRHGKDRVLGVANAKEICHRNLNELYDWWGINNETGQETPFVIY